jgi:drug/metabolite transporter (DMT)-like permease
MEFPTLVIVVWSLWGLLLAGLFWILYLIRTERPHGPHSGKAIAFAVWLVITVLYGFVGVYIYFQTQSPSQPVAGLTTVAKYLGGFLFLLVFGPVFDRVRKWWWTRGI